MQELVKLQLLVIAFILLIAGTAFASLSYNVSVDANSLSDSTGHLYIQYITAINQFETTTATVQNFKTDGTLGAVGPNAFSNSGTYVSGTLSGIVSLTNGNVETNDYNHAITFGSTLNFSLLLPTGTAQNAGSSFTFGLDQDAVGKNPLKTNDGTLFTINLDADGTGSTIVADTGTSVTATPILAAAWLLGSSLMGLVDNRRKMQN